MRIRLLTTVLCSVFVLHGVLPSTAADETPALKAIALIDDFEDGDLVGWAAPTGACTAVNTPLTGANGSSRSLRIDGDCAHYFGTWFDLFNFQATSVSFWVRSGATFLLDGYVVLGDDNVTTDHGVVFFAAASNGHFIIGALAGPSTNSRPTLQTSGTGSTSRSTGSAALSTSSSTACRGSTTCHFGRRQPRPP